MALPDPVARLLGAAAGRRALQLALLVGGLIVLGIVCGGRAQADDLSDGAPGTGSLRSGQVAVREHVADSARTLREAASPEASAPAHVESAERAEHAKPEVEHAEPEQAEPEHVPAKAPAPTRDRIATPEREPAPAAEPAPAPHQDVVGVQHMAGAKRLADVRHAAPSAPDEHTATAPTAPTVPTAPTDATELTAAVRTQLSDDALRYLTAPVGHTVRQVTGPVEELATRVVVQLVEAVPEQLTHGGLGRLGGLIDVVRPAGTHPTPPAATTATQRSNAPAAHGDRPSAEADHRPHAGASGPQAYDVASFGDVQKAAEGHDTASPASPFAPQRPDGVPSVGATAGDGGSARHGDLHAAAFGERAPVLLASGGTASAGTSPVVDRLREVPEFPG
ncbi:MULTISPECIES: hypothetical protein [unclassified Streptomyces]|uniref:hypothetical protein n=1 Tax=unclassified Streptomyces TaxID=2593676 RepID=UPI00278C7F10|nr:MULTISPECIES: hypothetical protein [unclassified Streptomyces]